jgi:hypothetical protein
VRTGHGAYQPIIDLLPHLRVKVPQAELALELQEHLLSRSPSRDDPWPWAPAGYDPTPHFEALRREVVEVLNQGRRMPLPTTIGAP